MAANNAATFAWFITMVHAVTAFLAFLKTSSPDESLSIKKLGLKYFSTLAKSSASALPLEASADSSIDGPEDMAE